MKFCIWGNIFSSYNDKNPGGAEGQLYLTAKYLTELGNKVYIIDFELNEDLNKNGIIFISLKKRTKFKFLWFYFLLKILIEKKADFYYCRVRSFIHILGYLAARINKSKFIYHFAHDLEASSFYARYKHIYSKLNLIRALFRIFEYELIFKYYILSSDFNVSQNQFQLSAIKKINNNTVLIDNIFEFKNLNQKLKPKPFKEYFISVGYIDSRKGIDFLFKLINKCKNKNFLIIGKPRDSKSKSLISKLINKKNVKYFNKISNSDVIHYMSYSKALISTSLTEGFPNNFIESWSVGKPVLSLFINPSFIFESNQLGYYCNGDLKILTKKINNFNTEEYDTKFLIKYVKKYHDPKTNIKKLLNVINS